MSKPACYALTAQGADLARRLAQALEEGADIFLPESLDREGGFASLPTLLRRTFAAYKVHIVIGAAGVAVRSAAPYLTHKSSDPAMVVCDERGRFAVSLLSGHWGGGNDWARRVAAITGGEAVITTATDGRGLPALDVAAREAGCVILDWDGVKRINGALLRGEPVRVYDPLGVLDLPRREPLLQPAPASGTPDPDWPTVWVDWRRMPPGKNLLRLAVPVLHVGVGCRRGVAAEEILEAVRLALDGAGLEPRAVADMASVTLKENEPGLAEAAAALGVPLRFFSPEALADMAVLTPSAAAAGVFGVENICVSEGAALLAADSGGHAALPAPKIRYKKRVTVAVAVPENMMPQFLGKDI